MKNILMKVITISALSIGAAGCDLQTAAYPPSSPVGVEQMQTKSFIFSKNQVFNGTITALQNLGYIIKRSNKAAGTISVIGSTKSTSTPGRTVNNKVCHGKGENQKCHTVTTQEPSKSATTCDYGTVTITTDHFMKMANVRLNFRVKETTSSQNGQKAETDSQITDPAFYQNIFDQISRSTFMNS
ncbi:MAG: hypothetical protein CMF39_01540 [Legionellaceae bacterium]|nr:hypothetical protein [Legionellaceae bacterium]|tara:strand:- start:1515 stop:2069 length:555 start_codon:yes stop_codon:yes gene_type:complete